MEKSDENIIDTYSSGYPDQVQILFNFLVEKKNFQLELFKSVEQKAVQLVLFSGIMIGLILNLTNIYPILFNQINIELLRFSYFFVPLSFICFFVSIATGLKVLSNSLFIDTFFKYGLVSRNNKQYFIHWIESCNKEVTTNLYTRVWINELTKEIEILKVRNSTNSPTLKGGFLFFSIGVFLTIISVLKIV